LSFVEYKLLTYFWKQNSVIIQLKGAAV
jgi:hypothetical protein